VETYEPNIPVTGEEVYEPAPMWKRLIAAIIDYLIIASLVLFFAMVIEVFFYIVYPGISTDPEFLLNELNVKGITALLFIIIFTVYYSLMESSRFQATFGKMALVLYVTAYDGNRIRFSRALVRTLGKFISNSCFYFGYILGFFTEYNRMLHDFIAKTYVVEKAPPVEILAEEEQLPEQTA